MDCLVDQKQIKTDKNIEMTLNKDTKRHYYIMTVFSTDSGAVKC